MDNISIGQLTSIDDEDSSAKSAIGSEFSKFFEKHQLIDCYQSKNEDMMLMKETARKKHITIDEVNVVQNTKYKKQRIRSNSTNW